MEDEEGEKRLRMDRLRDRRPTERLLEIERIAAGMFAESGFYGTSLQNVADRVGITKVGLLHHVGNKNNLLVMVLRDVYDREMEGRFDDFVADVERRSRGAHIPAAFRYIARVNGGRRDLVRLYTTLNTESLNPEHPAHDFFVERNRRTLSMASAPYWRVPDGVDAKAAFMAGCYAMDGLQVQWLRDPDADLMSMWTDVERTLFPSSIWEGYC